MASLSRDELVGKRFLSVKSARKLKVGKISEWEWRHGFVRAVSTQDTSNPELTVLVEFDDTGWKSREYIRVHQVFQVFLVEHTLSWVQLQNTNTSDRHGQWPALCFKPVVDKVGLCHQTKRPVEYLNDRTLCIVDDKDIIHYKGDEENTLRTITSCPEIGHLVKAWLDYQEGQKILLNTPTLLLGYRVEVYRTEGTTQWYTAVIKAYNQAAKTLTLTDDTVLEEHNEDPRLIQMHLIGDGVVDSILSGVDVGVAQRKRPRSTISRQNSRDTSSSLVNVSRGISNCHIVTAAQRGISNCHTVTPAQRGISNCHTVTPAQRGGISSNSRTSSHAVTPAETKQGNSAPTLGLRVTTIGSSSVVKGGHAKLRTAKVDVVIPSPIVASAVKGKQQETSSRQIPYRKPQQAAKETLVRQLRTEDCTGEGNIKTRSSVWKQACNKVVKQIKEESDICTETKDSCKPSSPVLRHKGPKNKLAYECEGNKHNDSLKGIQSFSDSPTVNGASSAGVEIVVNNKRKHLDNTKNKGRKAVGTTRVPVPTEEGESRQALSAKTATTSVLLACDNDKDLDQTFICDIGRTSDINSSAVLSAPANILSWAPPISCVQYNIENIDTGLASKRNENEDVSNKQVTIKGLSVKNNKVSFQKEICPIRETLPNKDCFNIVDTRSCSDLKSEEDMHYKKQILRAGNNINSLPNSPQAPSVSEGCLLTGQPAKGRNSDKCSLKGGDGRVGSEQVNSTKALSSPVFASAHHDNRPESNSLTMPHDAHSERQSAFTSVQSNIPRSRQNTPTVIDRADSRSSDGQLSMYSDSKQSSSRLDDVRSVKSSPGTSPLIMDRNEPIHPYRDPDLLHTNAIHSHIQSVLAGHHKMGQSAFPLTRHSPVPAASASSPAAPAFSGASTLPARSLLSTLPSTLPYTGTHPLLSSIPHHLTHPHSYPIDAVVRAQQQQQQLAALQQQQQHLLGYSLNNAATIATLEALWQQNMSAAPLPAHYVLKKNQEALLSTELAAALQREHLQLQMEHGRRAIEVGRRERERMEQERREKEHTEIIERERQERELLEKERIKRERQEWEYKQSQERILQENVDTVAAVDQHFAESLTRLASQQGISIFPPIAHAAARGFIPKTETHSLPQPHSLPFHEKKHLEHRIEDQLNKEINPPPDDKRSVNKIGIEKSSGAASYPCTPGSYHADSSLSQSSHKPLFNLYGYPSSHSTITAEQLKLRGLVSETRHIKEEVLDKNAYSSGPPHTPSPVHSNPGYCLKDVKQELHNSVIVKSDSKTPLKVENQVAAHSHHNSPSLASSSPRPQHQWLAHSSDHRPDRPLTSSSPASSVRLHHHLHHSSPGPTSFGHPPSSHSAVFSSSPSPYTAAASQSQPLNFCKSSDIKIEAPEKQQQPPQAHTSYTSAQTFVSAPNSVIYNYSLIQQGLVPNPMYSQGGVIHPAGSPLHSVGGPSANSIVDSKPSQISPGSKRKIAVKDNNTSNKKKSKSQAEISLTAESISIPVTTSQIITNPSPYTTSSSSSMSARSEVSSVTCSSPALISASLPYSTGFMDSFKSFVENTVQIAFLQDEKKAREKAERDQAQASQSPSPLAVSEVASCDRELSCQILSDNSSSATSVATKPDIPQINCKSYNSRIINTINRVASNQADADSDTFSASSPSTPVRPSGAHSPSSRNCQVQSSSHPHHMKKAWLQRHDEDKKSATPISAHNEEDSNSGSSHTRDVISCIENPSVSLVSGNRESRSASPANVVVTLPNGNLNEFDPNDESTSSASETEMQDSPAVIDSKKRVSSGRVASGLSKKAKSDVDSHSCTPSPAACNNSNSSAGAQKHTSNSNKRDRTDKQNDSQIITKDDQLNMPLKHSHGSPYQQKPQKKNNQGAATALENSLFSHLERSEPSPCFSENSSADMSPASSSSSSVSTTAAALKSSIEGSIRKIKDKKKLAKPNKEPTSKDSKKNSSFNKPLVKMTVATLKRTMVPFVQDGPCSEITPKLNKCRECKMTPGQRKEKLPNIFCRFYAFRRLKYNARGIVMIDGFSDLSDADPDDIEPWLPRFPVQDPELDVENSKFIIAKVGDKFCELVEQEKQAKSWAGDNVKIVWKRAVTGVREMCDVCDTTLFNMHWVCHKCGFVVCLDCFKVRMKDSKKAITDDKWLTCSSNRQAHKAREMMLTQIIPSDALWELGRLIHDIRSKWSIPSNCPCGCSNTDGRITARNGLSQVFSPSNAHKLQNGFGSEENTSRNSSKARKEDQEPYTLKNFESYNPDTTSSPLSILADIASMEPNSDRDKSDVKKKMDKSGMPGDDLLEDSEKKSGCSTLRELLTKTAGKPRVTNEKKVKKTSGLSSLDDIIQSVVERSCTDGGTPFKFLHYTPRLGGWKRELPIMEHSLTETSVLYPDVPHSWLCNGRLLRLHDAHHKGNVQIFQEQWQRGQPVLVSCADKKMNISLWKPEVFIREFGDIENEVVNCRTGDVIIGHTMGDFWGGFESLRNRPIDNNDQPMLLKLKDWPPGDDFSELLPTRFQDLMNALPLPEYTHRNGKLNLASRLPDFLVRPDLGPKMYNAYGSSHFPKEGTTNLHLDISDAVNVLVYVGVPGDGSGGRKAQEEAAVKAIDDAGCDNITKRRVREVNEIPGALWHIYDAHDADKIRDFLNKVAKERGEIIERDHDAIHDQSWYLDKELCDRLLREYGVQGYTIVQCLGDAIFIPAGAPHQVRNLHSCVKVAEDFVSPEHLNHCFRLTQEFRQLSETHSNHEDKLQVKNIIYHAVKDAMAVLRERDPEDE